MRKTLTYATICLFGGFYLSANAIEIPFFAKKKAAAERTRAIGHAKQMLIAFTVFEFEFGVRPGVLAAAKIPGAKSASANDCFRQILLGIPEVRSEAIFYAASNISKKPDNEIGDIENNFQQACAKGEVGFAYIDAPDAKDGAPLAIAPLLDAKSGKFDHKKYGGKAVVLMTDGSVQSLDIDPKTGKVFIEVAGKKVDLLSKENPHFRTPPSIRSTGPKEVEEKKDEVEKP